jgi:hypothetical protein
MNAGERPVFYLAGCSARCRPIFYRPISFEVSGPDGAEVLVNSNEFYPCEGPAYCPEFPEQISPGESLEEALQIDGTAWKQDSTGGAYCGVCTAEPFKEGRYAVRVRSSYSPDAEGVYTPTGQVETTVEFDWP